MFEIDGEFFPELLSEYSFSELLFSANYQRLKKLFGLTKIIRMPVFSSTASKIIFQAALREEELARKRFYNSYLGIPFDDIERRNRWQLKNS